MVTDQEIYLTTEQAARQLGVSRRTLLRAVDRGEMPAHAKHPAAGRCSWPRMSMPLPSA